MSSNNNSTAIPSPEEWLESHPEAVSIIDGDFVYTAPWVEGLLQSYAAHVAALVHRNTRHRAAEILMEDHPLGATEVHRGIMQIPLRAVYPAPAGEEKPMITIDVVCQACKTEYCINVPTTIGDFSTECPECGIDVHVYIDSIVEETPGGENITDLPAEEINRLVDHITDVIIEDEQNQEE